MARLVVTHEEPIMIEMSSGVYSVPPSQDKTDSDTHSESNKDNKEHD